LGAPPVVADREHFDDVRAAVDDFLEANNFHGGWILTIAAAYTSEAACEAAPGLNRGHHSLASS
jgi:hypothetical protein